MADMDAAAAALADHLAQLPRSCRGRMPTHAELRAAGRHDLRYAVQVYFETELVLLFVVYTTHTSLSLVLLHTLLDSKSIAVVGLLGQGPLVYAGAQSPSCLLINPQGL